MINPKISTELKKESLFEIIPAFYPSIIDNQSFETYIQSVTQLLEKIIPIDIFKKAILSPTKENIQNCFLDFHKKIPFISCSEPSKNPSCFSFTVLCFGDHTHGIGRFIPDMLNRWLIPGKQLAIFGNRSMQFTFKHFLQHKYYLAEFLINITNNQDLELIQRNLPLFIQEIKINILAVYHARHIMALKSLSTDQRSSLIQDNISLLINKNVKEVDTNTFDHMQEFLTKLSSEKKLSQIKQNITDLMYKKPRNFDRDIFDAIHHISQLFPASFTSVRDPKHISKLISLQYLFQKALQKRMIIHANHRQIIIKFIKQKQHILGILVTFNLLHESEIFEKRHLIKCISNCITNVKYIKDSFIRDKRDEKIRTFYIEIEKTPFFTNEEIKELRKKLPIECEDQIENFVSQVFLPSNEEEAYKNIIILSKQLKYTKDVPQVIINYESQNKKEIIFTVFLVRLLKQNSSSLKELFSKADTTQFTSDEIKIVGYLKKKYPKEANIFKLSLDKTLFIRNDYSLDIQKARRSLVSELAYVIGDFRDFNGGMIHKQNEILDFLKNSLLPNEKTDEFLLENFFFSIKPGIMTSIFSFEIIKSFCLLSLNIIKENFSKDAYIIKTTTVQNDLIVGIASSSFLFKEEVTLAVNKLRIPSFKLASSFLEKDNIFTLGYIFHPTDQEELSLFYGTILESLKRWKENFFNIQQKS